MSNSDSEDFESADEDLNVSEIGEDELDELLADVPDPDESDSKVDIQERLSGKDNSNKIKNNLELYHDKLNVIDNNIPIPNDENRVLSDPLAKPSETPTKTDIDKSNNSHNNSIKINNIDTNTSVNPCKVKTTCTNNEAFNYNASSEKGTAEHLSLAYDNSTVDDNSNGWDFEDDDVVLPVSAKEKHDLSTQKQVGQKEDLPTKPMINNSGWSGWGNWGVSNLISSASEGVSNLSLTMTSGLTSMLETTIGAPDPQELAKQLAMEENPKEPFEDEPPRTGIGSSDLFGFGNIIGGVSNLGSKVISGGLDTLETLGKKTMEVLQEGDPGFKKKRALLFQGEKVILSQVLREAKEKAEANEHEKERDKTFRKVQYESLFDDFHGLVHLEALEMISKQCEIKLNSLMSKYNSDDLIHINEISNKVKHLFDEQQFSDECDKSVESDENLKDTLDSVMNILELNVNTNNVIQVDAAINTRLSQVTTDATDIHAKAISDLAQYTAVSTELFHRIAELLIVKESSNYEDNFQALVRVTTITKGKIGTISENYSSKIMILSDKSFSPLITNIFLEASNSGTYLENAFELFLPILQLKALS